MIKTVIRLQNDMVLVFDESGEELPEYQGFFYEVRDKILADVLEGAIFKHWFGYWPRPRTVKAECF